jgi:hypothetical protein
MVQVISYASLWGSLVRLKLNNQKKKSSLHNTNHSSPGEAIEKWLAGWVIGTKKEGRLNLQIGLNKCYSKLFRGTIARISIRNSE